MSSFWQTIHGLVLGYLETAGRAGAITHASGRDGYENGRIDRLCGQLGWAADDRVGNTIVLHFKDPHGAVRKMFIDGGDEPLVNFTVYANTSLPEREVPQEVVGYLLLQNCDVAIGAWQVQTAKDDNAFFRVMYRALGPGLTAERLGYICQSMIGEATAFDRKMHAAGLLHLS